MLFDRKIDFVDNCQCCLHSFVENLFLYFQFKSTSVTVQKQIETLDSINLIIYIDFIPLCKKIRELFIMKIQKNCRLKNVFVSKNK